MSAGIVTLMLTLRNQIKIYHWQTNEFSRHKATDELVETLDKNIDRFTEIYMGKYGRPNFKGKTACIKIHNFHDTDGPKYLQSAVNWFSTQLPKYLKETDTDLLTIRDEILADLNQAKYLFTLH
jgi:DNA-binding ferritin-like protein